MLAGIFSEGGWDYSNVKNNKAERQGFEPWEPEGSTVFETAPFNRSGTSPTYWLYMKYFNFAMSI